uniref:Uncharacterized protein n=1 Tax=Pithovirus LCPAC202 TaxID=2506592 RepID=A0A481Z7W3_9VIRU|nr:MAG: uncharacterized protein LCPAC202_01840 [Pithovirus LCPAC202]
MDHFDHFEQDLPNLEMMVDPSEFPDSGIIFVRSEDVLSLVCISITKQPYSTIGFFYKTSVSGEEKINIILVDIHRFVQPTWLERGANIEDIIRNPLVSSIGIKGLNPVLDENGKIDKIETQKLHSMFRQAIGNVIGHGTGKSYEETISQLFGYKVKHPSKGVTAVEMVNRVIMAMGKWNDVPQDGSLSAEALKLLKAPTLLGCGIESKTKMIQILTSNFNQQEVCNPTVANKLIQSYIVDNGVFGEMMRIGLPDRDPHRVRMSQEQTYILNSDYMARSVATFTKMLIHDQGFYESLLAGFNQSRLIDSDGDGHYKHDLSDLSSDSDSLAEIVTSWIGTGEISYSKIISCLVKMDQTKQHISEKHSIFLDCKKHYPVIDRSKLLLIKKDNCQDRDDKLMVGAFMSLREEIKNLSNQIGSKSTPILSINDLIRPLNDIANSLGLSVPNLQLVGGDYTAPVTILVKSNRAEGVPLTLKSGTKIILTLINPNLEGLAREDLIEILESLDNMASNDHRFDNLRSIITTKLSHL